MVHSLKVKQALELQMVAKVKSSGRIPVCVTCPHLVTYGFPRGAFRKVCAAANAVTLQNGSCLLHLVFQKWVIQQSRSLMWFA